MSDEEKKIIVPEGEEAPPKEPTALSEENKPCGCLVRNMDNKTTQVYFCPPHALLQCAQALGNAAGALQMAANRLINDQTEMAAHQELQKGKRAVEKGMKRFLRGKRR